MLRKTRGKIALLLISVTVAASACGGSGDRPDVSKVPFDSANTKSEILRLAGLLSKSEADSLAVADVVKQESFVKNCMAAQKFAYYVKSPQSLVDLSSAVDQSSMDDARSHGFAVATVPHFAPEGPENDDYYQRLNPGDRSRYDKAISTCSDSAVRAAGAALGLDVAAKDYVNIKKVLSGSPEYQAAGSAWEKCATSAGYHFASRDDLVSSFVKRRHGMSGVQLESNPEFVQLRNDEIRAAVATFSCTQVFNGVRRRLIANILQSGSLGANG